MKLVDNLSARNIEWQLWKDDSGYAGQQIQLALLMDIRRELQRLNCLLNCPRFTGIPSILTEIERNTGKRKRLTKKR